MLEHTTTSVRARAASSVQLQQHLQPMTISIFNHYVSLFAQIRLRTKAGETMAVEKMKIPMVDLPLGATEDRVCGTIDIEKALTEGEVACLCSCIFIILLHSLASTLLTLCPSGCLCAH